MIQSERQTLEPFSRKMLSTSLQSECQFVTCLQFKVDRPLCSGCSVGYLLFLFIAIVVVVVVPNVGL